MSLGFRAKLTAKAKRRISRLGTGHAAVAEARATQRYAQQVTLKR